MSKPGIRWTSLVLVFMMLSTIVAPVSQSLAPVSAYAAVGEAVPFHVTDLPISAPRISASEMSAIQKYVSNLTISNGLQLVNSESPSNITPAATDTNQPTSPTMSESGSINTGLVQANEPTSLTTPFTVQFERPNYYAVRSDDYIYIPLILNGTPYSDKTAVNYNTANGTAIAGLDYTASGGYLALSTPYQPKGNNYIRIKLKNNPAVAEDRTFIVALTDAIGVSVGDLRQTTITIRSNIDSNYDYVGSDSWETLYLNGGTGNWDGMAVGNGFGAVEDEYQRYIFIAGQFGGGRQGVQAKKTYRMSQLKYAWTTDGNGILAVVSTLPGNVNAKPDVIPSGQVRSDNRPTTCQTWQSETRTLNTEDAREPLYVGFYADPSSHIMLRSASILKKKFVFHVTIPSGSALTTAGRTFQGSFNGKFTYDDSNNMLKAIPPEGHSFVGWNLYLPDGQTVTLTGSPEMSINDLIKGMDETYFALYEKDNLGIQLRPVFKKNEYVVAAVYMEGGSVTGSGKYLHGDNVTLIATPNPDYGFYKWTSSGKQGESKDNPWNFAATESLTATAFFKKTVNVTLEASPPEGGTVALEGAALENIPVTARATAKSGYRFVKWIDQSGKLIGQDSEYQFNAAEGMHLTAIFEQINSRITVKAYPVIGGTASISSSVYNHHGDTVTLTAEPNDEYDFINWTENGTQVSTNPIYAFTVGTEVSDGDHVFTAIFRLKPGSFILTPSRQFTGVPVAFDASGMFRNDAGITFHWQFGDGATDEGNRVTHSYAGTGTYDVTVQTSGPGPVTKTRSITIVEPLPLEESDFKADPEGVKQVEPGDKASWKLTFTNNGVPMSNKVIAVNDELLGGSANITTNASGEALYETSVPAQAPYDIYNITFSYDTLSAARTLQVYSSRITLTGQVFSSVSGRRLSDVRVSAGGKSAVTDSQGQYRITDLHSGPCAVTASLEDFEVSYCTIDLVSAQTVHNIPLVRYNPGTVPVIGWVHSERSDSASLVDKYFTYQVSLPLKFNVDIDWRGNEPGSINFILPDKTVAGAFAGDDPRRASRIIDVGSEIIPGGRVNVQAEAADGQVTSVPVDARIEIMPPPPIEPDVDTIEPPPIPPMTLAQDMPFIGGGQLSLDLKALKFEVEHDVNGVISVFIGVAAKKKDMKPSDVNDKNKLEELKEAYKELKGAKSVYKPTAVDVSLIVGGKLVFVYNTATKKLDLKEGWLVIKGEGEVTKTAQFITPIFIPVYISGTIGGAVTVHVGITPEEIKKFQATMTPEMWVRVSAGVGIADLLAAEVFAKLHGGFTMDLGAGRIDNWIADATVGVKAVVFWFDWEKSWTKTWQSPNNTSGMVMVGQNDQSDLPMIMGGQGEIEPPSTAEMKPLSRDYLQRPSVFLPQSKLNSPVALVGVTDGSVSSNRIETVIQQNIFPYSEPDLIMTSDGPVLVWVADDPQRSDDNRTEVQYSKLQNGTWTVPQAVSDDGTADFYPKAVAVTGQSGTTAAAAWTNAAKVMDSGAGLDDLLSQNQTAVSLYNGAWDNQHVFSVDGFKDTSPKIANLDGSTMVVWNRSAISSSVYGSVYSETEDLFAVLYPQQTNIMYSQWNGAAWSEPKDALSRAGSVIKSSLTGFSSNALFAYTVDVDGNFNTTEDQELYYMLYGAGGWNSPVRVTNNQVKDTNPQAVYLAGEPMIFWYQDGKVLSLKVSSSEMVTAVDSQGEGLANFVLARGVNGNLAMVWGEGAGSGQEIFTSVHDPINDSWSQPIQLTSSGALNRSISAVLDQDGNILAVYNRTSAEAVKNPSNDGTEQVNIVEGPTDLLFTKLTVGHDGAVENLTLSRKNPAPGSEVTISAIVANQGELAEKDLEAAFYEGDPLKGGKQIGNTVVITGLLAAGASKEVTVQWTVPKKLESCNVYVVVDPDAKLIDRNRNNNTKSIAALKTDLKVINVKSEPTGYGQYLITPTVTNRGFIAAEDTKVSLYNTKAGEYGPEKGDLIETISLGRLQPGQQTDETFTWGYTGKEFKDGYTFLMMEAGSEQENIIGGDRTARVLVREPASGVVAVVGFALDNKEISLQVGGKQQLWGIFDPPDATNRAIIWESTNNEVARVDTNGKVTAINTGTAVITASTVDGGKSDTCKVTVISKNNNNNYNTSGGGSTYVYVTGVTLNKHGLTLTAGAAGEKLTAKVSPTTATNMLVSWKSSDSKVASVDNSGIITPRAAGTATITVTTDNGSKTDTCTVTVEAAQPMVIKPEPAVSCPRIFTDLNQHWAATAIGVMSGKGIVNGYTDGTFRPGKVMSRLEFIVILCKTRGLEADNAYKLRFRDASRIPAWGKGYVAAAVKAGLLPKVWGSLLNSTAPITRAEIAYMVSGAIGGSSMLKLKFKDKIPVWAAKEVANVVAKKLMSGYKDGTFKAGKAATRAEVCSLMVNMLNLKLAVK